MVNCIVNIHKTVKDVNEKLKKGAKKHNFITPRDYLDFIKHFVDVEAEKKEELQDQQLHLNTGLDKLKDTEQQVIELQASLAVYQKDLQEKEIQANEKLTQMMDKQKEAEKKKEESMIMKDKLTTKQQEISERQEVVMNDLSEALPALEDAQNSVNSINKKHLDIIKNLPNPPVKVKMAVEATICLITQSTKEPTWKECKQHLMKDFKQ